MLAELQKRISPDVKAGEPMAPHTTFRVGGPAEYFFAAKTTDQAILAARTARELGLPFFVFGGGSNMVVADAGIRGLTVMMVSRGFTIDGTTVIADAGAVTGLVSTRATEAGLTGFEWAVGVPGTIGGAVRGNAGAYGGETKDSLVSVRALIDGEERVFQQAECAFSYRDSIFKRTPGSVVLSATFELALALDPAAAKARLRQILIDRKQKQPIEFPTGGSTFGNWHPSSQAEVEALRVALDLDPDELIPQSGSSGIPAAWLLDRAGLKGFSIGHVRVSEKHGNFFVTDGKASADEIVQLAAAVKSRVREMTGGVVQLTEEIEYVGF